MSENQIVNQLLQSWIPTLQSWIPTLYLIHTCSSAAFLSVCGAWWSPTPLLPSPYPLLLRFVNPIRPHHHPVLVRHSFMAWLAVCTYIQMSHPKNRGPACMKHLNHTPKMVRENCDVSSSTRSSATWTAWILSPDDFWQHFQLSKCFLHDPPVILTLHEKYKYKP